MINEAYKAALDSGCVVAKIKAHEVHSTGASLVFRKNFAIQQIMRARTSVRLFVICLLLFFSLHFPYTSLFGDEITGATERMTLVYVVAEKHHNET